MDTLSDAALMLRYQQEGDFAAFETLFIRHKDAFVTFLWQLSGSQTVAEDVSQHCWLQLIEDGSRYRPMPGAAFRTFLYAMGRNRYIDEYTRRHEASRTQSLDATTHDQWAGEARDPGTDASQAETARLLKQAIAALPFEQREVIALWAGGTSTEEMCMVTRAPRDTVLSRKKYAIAKLRRLLNELGIERHEPA